MDSFSVGDESAPGGKLERTLGAVVVLVALLVDLQRTLSQEIAVAHIASESCRLSAMEILR